MRTLNSRAMMKIESEIDYVEAMEEAAIVAKSLGHGSHCSGGLASAAIQRSFAYSFSFSSSSSSSLLEIGPAPPAAVQSQTPFCCPKSLHINGFKPSQTMSNHLDLGCRQVRHAPACGHNIPAGGKLSPPRPFLCHPRPGLRQTGPLNHFYLCSSVSICG